MNTKKKLAAAAAGKGAKGRPEDQRLPIGSTFAYGFQHVLTMYGGIIAPPLIIGAAAGMNSQDIGLLIAACLFVGGLATILQTVGIPFFGSQLPLVQGVSFPGGSTILAPVHAGRCKAGFRRAARPRRNRRPRVVARRRPRLRPGRRGLALALKLFDKDQRGRKEKHRTRIKADKCR